MPDTRALYPSLLLNLAVLFVFYSFVTVIVVCFVTMNVQKQYQNLKKPRKRGRKMIMSKNYKSSQIEKQVGQTRLLVTDYSIN